MKSLKTLDWITQYDFLDNYKLIGKSDAHQLKMPKSINEKYRQVFNQNKIQIDNPYFWVSLNNSIVSCFDQGISGVSIRTNNGFFLEDINPYWSESIFKNDVRIRYLTETPCILIANKWGGYNYFHYIHTCLPRLAFFHRTNMEINYKLIVNSFSVFILESLSLLNYCIEDMIPLSAYSKIKAKNLKTVSSIGYGVNPNKESCKLVRSLFSNLFLSGKKRLYISRSNAKSRKVLHEDKLINILIPLGFEIVNSESLLFVDQIQLFSQAEVVISAHGAGLTNIVFCNPGTKVLELFSPQYLGLCYFLVSDSCNLDYYYLMGKGKCDSLSDYWYSDGTANLNIDIEEFKKTLELMEIV